MKLEPLNQPQFKSVCNEFCLKVLEIREAILEKSERKSNSASRSQSMVIAWLKDIEKSEKK